MNNAEPQAVTPKRRGRPRKDQSQPGQPGLAITGAALVRLSELAKQDGLSPERYLARMVEQKVNPAHSKITILVDANAMRLLKDFGSTFTCGGVSEAHAAHWILLWALAHYRELRPSIDRFIKYHEAESDDAEITQWRMLRDMVQTQAEEVAAKSSQAIVEPK